MQTNFPEGGIINLTINNMDGNYLPSPAPAPEDKRPLRDQDRRDRRGHQRYNARHENLTSNLNTSMVIEAKQVQTEYITCNKVDENVFLNYLTDNEKYSTRIHSSDDFWTKNKLFFHNDFDKFFSILKSTFNNEENQIKWSIIKKTEKEATIQISKDDVFLGFKINIVVKRETPCGWDIHEKKITQLERENINLKKNIHDINNEIMRLKTIFGVGNYVEDDRISENSLS
jgi:hypothetical protein